MRASSSSAVGSRSTCRLGRSQDQDNGGTEPAVNRVELEPRAISSRNDGKQKTWVIGVAASESLRGTLGTDPVAIAERDADPVGFLDRTLADGFNDGHGLIEF